MLSPQLLKIAASENTILITGKTGTGKSHIAKKIHLASKRKDKKFTAINLATLSESLIESELFGHEKGAFSGAEYKRIGKLESAHGGTVFLDEIGELSLKLQVKLLEALNSKTISPVGSNRDIQLDIRIIAATNKNLWKMIEEGSFREDLFFRINTFQLELPELSKQPEKIDLYAKKFAFASAEKQGKVFQYFHEECVHTLKGYNWPGNIRELKNCIEFSIAMSSDGTIRTSDLPPYLRNQTSSTMKQDFHYFTYSSDYRAAKAHFEKHYLIEVLRRFNGKINLTARKTGLSKVTLIEKVRRYEIDVPKIKYQSHCNINKELA